MTSGFLKAILIIFSAFFCLGASANATLTDAASTLSLEESLKHELAKRFTGSRIVLNGTFIWAQPIGKLERIQSVSLLEENNKGQARFLVKGVFDGQLKQSELSLSYSAMVPALVAIRRIYPGQALSKDAFSIQDVNVATGLAREMRGVMLSVDQDLSRVESRQTILEGQYATTPAVQRIPDLRRGDAVRIRLNSGVIRLSTSGIAQEPAHVNGTVRVITQKTKRELTGKLLPNGIVEVAL